MHTHAVWLHSDSVWDVREDTDGVSPVLAIDEAIALEIKAVDVCLWAQSWQVPCYFLPITHTQAWEVPVHKSIDGCGRGTKQTEYLRMENKLSFSILKRSFSVIVS